MQKRWSNRLKELAVEVLEVVEQEKEQEVEVLAVILEQDPDLVLAEVVLEVAEKADQVVEMEETLLEEVALEEAVLEEKTLEEAVLEEVILAKVETLEELELKKNLDFLLIH